MKKFYNWGGGGGGGGGGGARFVDPLLYQPRVR